MNIDQVNDLADARLSPFRDLPHRSDEEFFVVESVRLVQRLIRSDYEITSVLIDSRRPLDFLEGIDEGTNVIQMSREQIRKLVGFPFHRGVMAAAKRAPPLPVSCLYSDSLTNSQLQAAPKVTLGVIQITDKENLGGIMRSAAAFGVNQILLSDDTVDPFSRRVTRVSMGTVFQHKMYRIVNPAIELQALAKSGYRIVASSLAEDSTPVSDFQSDDRPVLLLVGNESKGLPESIQKISDDKICIPMNHDTDSLNVSVATAILLYELTN